MSDMKQQVEAMIKKAGESPTPEDAMKYAQAALNAANAMCCLASLKNQPK